MYCYSCPRMSQGCMIAHACWIGMISSCYCSQLDTQKMIQNAMSLQTLLGINLRTLHSPPLACSFPIERTNCFVHTHTRIYLHAYMEAYMHASIHCYVDIYLHTLIDAYIHPRLHTCLHTYVHTSHTQTIRRTCIHPSYMHTCRLADIPTVCVRNIHAGLHTYMDT